MNGFTRVLLDTNVVVSGLLFPGSAPSQALIKAQAATVLASDATLLELIEGMNRDRFDRYVSLELRQRLAAEFANVCETVPIVSSIRACRDPKDDKFLEAAVDGRADLIVTGDRDLLDLHPFRGIAILTAADYLHRE